ncbi:hypothetical protein AALC75_08945 [Lachnospiraceae bacterium 48-42]
MKDIIEIYNNYREVGIKNRTITEGQEMELVREYIKYRKDSFQGSPDRKMVIFLETKVDSSYPDIVFVEYNPNNYENWNRARGLLEKRDLKILYHLYSMGGGELSDLVTQLGVTWKDAGLAVERLHDSQLITRNCGKWTLIDYRQISTRTIQAVEAKINKLDEVLQQGIINRNFASESYALSILKSKPKKETLAKFKKFGVGLCVKNGDAFEVVKTAKQSHIPVSFNSILFNEWIGRILNLGGEVANAV